MRVCIASTGRMRIAEAGTHAPICAIRTSCATCSSPSLSGSSFQHVLVQRYTRSLPHHARQPRHALLHASTWRGACTLTKLVHSAQTLRQYWSHTRIYGADTPSSDNQSRLGAKSSNHTASTVQGHYTDPFPGFLVAMVTGEPAVCMEPVALARPAHAHVNPISGASSKQPCGTARGEVNHIEVDHMWSTPGTCRSSCLPCSAR